MSDDLNVNDAVLVEGNDASDTKKMQGVVAHLGPVQFAPGSDWIGVRLTGPSVGSGRNDGTVKGIKYFDTAAKNGMFVKRSHVTKRKLSRLEELRLRREVGDAASAEGGGGGSSAVAAAGGRGAASSTSSERTTPRKPSSSRSSRSSLSTPPPRAALSASSAPSATGGGGARSRLEEIRARREALARGREKGEDPPKTPAPRSSSSASISEDGDTGTSSEDAAVEPGLQTPEPARNDADGDDEDANNAPAATPAAASAPNLTTATPGYRAELTRLKDRITRLESDLRKKEDDTKSLQQSLDFMSKGAEQSTHDAVRMYALGALALTEAKTPGKEKATPKKVEGEGGGDDDGDDGSDGDSDDDSDEEGGPEEGIANQAAAAVSQALVQRNDELTSQVSTLTAKNTDLQSQVDEQNERLNNLTSRFTAAQEGHIAEKSKRMDELTRYETDRNVLQSQMAAAEREVRATQERISDRSESADASVVTVAKVRAELLSLTRKHNALIDEKMDLETTLEEVVLDKEQLKEEKEVLEEQYEECKIDLESAQLELEECKGELEQRQVEEEQGAVMEMAHAGTGGEGEAAGGGGARRSDAEDVARSLSLQNSRLRTALLRLREQSELERNELQRQVKLLERDSKEAGDKAAEHDDLKDANAELEAEVQELKDVVDQTSALEGTIEDLSDKVWNLEEQKAECERTIRELEESAEIAAEMEEVQAEEMQLLMRDLEGRDALVRNLEEAIRMQRKREEDFQRYVSEFRTTISKLKQERDTLAALREGGEGEKSHLLATSQKALAQAFQLAADAAEARKRDSDAAFARIDARVQSHLSSRLESLLPQGVVASELAAVRGELLLAKVVDKAAVSLTSVEDAFVKAIKKGVAGASEFNVVAGGESVVLTDAAVQQIATMVHQAEFANITVEAASDALRLIAVGQWPEVLTQESSSDLGSVVVHPMAELDMALSEQLRLLKQEGMLSPLRSSLTDLDQCVRGTRLALFDATDEKGKTVVPSEWKPPGWEALKTLSQGRFACLGAAAVLSSAVSPLGESDEILPPTLPNLVGALDKAEHICSAIVGVSKKLSGLPLNETEILESLDEQSAQYHAKSSELLECVKTVFSQKSISSEDVEKCTALLDEVVSSISRLGALVRKANLGEHDSNHFHSLSPETGDSWGGVARIVSQVRGVDGDADDVNFLMRARAIEHQLSEAVQNEPKLVISSAKISSLEKSLSSRSKEISMQNTRISELETFISKSNLKSRGPQTIASQASSTSAADNKKLKEEIRVLQEALEVTQKEAEEYEKALKDKSRPSRVRQSASGRKTPRKSAIGLDLESTMSQFGIASTSKAGSAASNRDALLEVISLETALFRPILSSSTQSASYWKAKAIGSSISDLPPLNIPIGGYSMPSLASDDAKRVLDDALRSTTNVGNKGDRGTEELSLARNAARLAKASFSVVDLSKKGNAPRSQLNEQMQRDMAVKCRLREATDSWLSSQASGNRLPAPVLPSSIGIDGERELWGRVAISRPETVGSDSYVVPLNVNRTELRSFHSHLVH